MQHNPDLKTLRNHTVSMNMVKCLPAVEESSNLEIAVDYHHPHLESVN